MRGLRAARHRSCPVLRRVRCSRRFGFLFRLERLFPLSGPQLPRALAILAVELFGHLPTPTEDQHQRRGLE